MKLTMNRLQQYCKDHKILVPKSASKTELEAAIARSYLHMSKVEDKCCYGYWGDEDMNCRFCDHENDCFKASIGMDKKKFYKMLERSEGGFKFKDSLRKKCKSKTGIKSCLI